MSEMQSTEVFLNLTKRLTEMLKPPRHDDMEVEEMGDHRWDRLYSKNDRARCDEIEGTKTKKTGHRDDKGFKTYEDHKKHTDRDKMIKKESIQRLASQYDN